jgi:hypothetical protein
MGYFFVQNLQHQTKPLFILGILHRDEMCHWDGIKNPIAFRFIRGLSLNSNSKKINETNYRPYSTVIIRYILRKK